MLGEQQFRTIGHVNSTSYDPPLFGTLHANERRMLRITSVAIVLTIITGSFVVRAAEPDPKTPPTKPFVPRVHLSAGVGVYGASRYKGGGLVDLLGLGRIKNFAFGVNLQGGTSLEFFSGDHFFSLAPTAGIFAPTPPWLQVSGCPWQFGYPPL